MPAWADVPACSEPLVTLTQDYGFLIGSAGYSDPDGDPQLGSTYKWLVNGSPLASGPAAELLHLAFDDSVAGSGGDLPLEAGGVGYANGRWGSALQLADDGSLRYGREGALSLTQGTVEMWVALRADGDDPVYADDWHVLLHYQAPDGDALLVAMDPDNGVLYAGGQVDGQWQSAYGMLGSTRSWLAGEWRHVACTYSAGESFIRFYVDGVLTADTNEGHYWAPSDGGTEVVIGSDAWGTTAHCLIDELRLSARVAAGAEIAARARRRDQPRANEVWLDVSQIAPGDSTVFEYTPADGSGAGIPCNSEPRVYPGIPLTGASPPSTLLPPGSTQVQLTVQSIIATSCRWAVGRPRPFSEMTPFDAGATEHHTLVRGLNPDPNAVNHVYVRCAAYPDYLLHLRYRSLSQVNPRFPRTGNLWGTWELLQQGLAHCARIDLWLGGDFSPAQIVQLRQINPQIRVLTSINAVENGGLPDDYYLKDIHGAKIEVWPGSYRLNLTKLYVAEHQAHFAYQRILDGDLQFDGCFFDNVMTTQSWQTTDIYGNPFLVDSNEDGVHDDPEVFDAAWNAGVFHEMNTFRSLAPHAIVSGHSMDIFEPGIAEVFNGISIGFFTTDVIEDKMSFLDLWRMAGGWDQLALLPGATMVESSPPDQIAYGYDYAPWDKIPPSTLEFARTYYPYVRFGLAFTLMTDAHFAHEFGDTWHGADWWYDELDFDLGYPLGPAGFLWLGGAPGDNLIENPGFEDPIAPPWRLWADTGSGCAAIVSRDASDAVEGMASARVDVSSVCDEEWKIDFAQWDRSLVQGQAYDLVFWAKADADRTIFLSAQKGSPDWRNYGLYAFQPITSQWQEYTVSFEANETVDDARILFFLGQTTGAVWLDHVRLTKRPPNVLRRDFTHGTVLLNATGEPLEIGLGSGYARLDGAQAPRFEALVDDGDPAFATSGAWAETEYDSGEWQAAGPFFHDWGPGCHESQGTAATARWDLAIPEADLYTVTAWWPAAPEADSWSAGVLYEIEAHGQVVASVTLDQRTGGDQWHFVAEVSLEPGDDALVRLSCADGEVCIADALHLRSAARYNDGSPAPSVTLQPMDGIVLAWTNPVSVADVNRDGTVDGLDVLEVVRAIFGQFTALDVDVNDDNAVDSADLAIVMAEAAS